MNLSNLKINWGIQFKNTSFLLKNKKIKTFKNTYLFKNHDFIFKKNTTVKKFIKKNISNPTLFHLDSTLKETSTWILIGREFIWKLYSYESRIEKIIDILDFKKLRQKKYLIDQESKKQLVTRQKKYYLRKKKKQKKSLSLKDKLNFKELFSVNSEVYVNYKKSLKNNHYFIKKKIVRLILRSVRRTFELNWLFGHKVLPIRPFGFLKDKKFKPRYKTLNILFLKKWKKFNSRKFFRKKRYPIMRIWKTRLSILKFCFHQQPTVLVKKLSQRLKLFKSIGKRRKGKWPRIIYKIRSNRGIKLFFIFHKQLFRRQILLRSLAQNQSKKQSIIYTKRLHKFLSKWRSIKKILRKNRRKIFKMQQSFLTVKKANQSLLKNRNKTLLSAKQFFHNLLNFKKKKNKSFFFYLNSHRFRLKKKTVFKLNIYRYLQKQHFINQKLSTYLSKYPFYSLSKNTIKIKHLITNKHVYIFKEKFLNILYIQQLLKPSSYLKKKKLKINSEKNSPNTLGLNYQLLRFLLKSSKFSTTSFKLKPIDNKVFFYPSPIINKNSFSLKKIKFVNFYKIYVTSFSSYHSLCFILPTYGFLFTNTFLFNFQETSIFNVLSQYTFISNRDFKKIVLSRANQLLKFNVEFFTPTEHRPPVSLNPTQTKINPTQTGNKINSVLYQSLKSYKYPNGQSLSVKRLKEIRTVARPRNIFIQRFRLKPGYSRMWRVARVAIKFLLNVDFNYQSRLTRYLSILSKVKDLTAKKLHELKLVNILTTLLFVPDRDNASLLLTSNLVFLNGYLTTNGSLSVVKEDFIQLLVNIKYYILFRWLRNTNLLKRKRLNKFIYKLGFNRLFKTPKKVRIKFPKWTLETVLFNYDIPKFVEVDYLTLSAFILYTPFLIVEFNPLLYKINRPYIYRNYNWKYIT